MDLVNPIGAASLVYIIQAMEIDGGRQAGDRPVIGLVGDARQASFGAWRDVDACLVWDHYLDALEGAGGVGLIAPPRQAFADDPALLVERIDGLLLTGGRDVDAATYGADAHPSNDQGDPRRDAVELAVARAALAGGVPLLGVCRGMQLLNVLGGGGIEQHLSDPDQLHRGPPGAFVPHPVVAEPGSLLAGILGTDLVEIRSHHHQGVGTVAPEMRITGRAPDGVVEAIERPGGEFCLAVLWHPEEDLPGGGQAIYEALVVAAAERKGRVQK